MKKLLYLLLILPIYAYSSSFDELEEAILEVNAEKVEKILKKIRPLTDNEIARYSDLAEYLIKEKYDTRIVNLLSPRNGYIVIGGIGACISLLSSLCYVVNCNDIEMLPIVSSIGLSILFCIIHNKGLAEEKITSKRLYDNYINAIKIKYLLYDQNIN